MTYNLNFITLNCKGLNDKTKRRSIFTFCRKYKYDIILLQETHSNIDSEKTWNFEWGVRTTFYSHGTNNSTGVAILLNNTFQHKILDKIIDDDGRFIFLLVETNDKQFIVANIYAPVNEKEQIPF